MLRCWLGRSSKPFDIVAINVGSMGAKTAAHLLKYDTVLVTLKANVSFTDDDAKTAAHLLKYDTVLGTLKANVSFTDDDAVSVSLSLERERD